MLARMIALPLLFFSAVPGWAEAEFSLYGGVALAETQKAIGSGPNSTNEFSFGPLWENPGMDIQQQPGIRIIWWRHRNQGWGLDLPPADVQSDLTIRSGNRSVSPAHVKSIRKLTINRYRKWPETWPVSTYLGAGLGIGIAETGTSTPTLIGPTMQWTAGARYPISEHWSVFGEYQGSFTTNTFVSDDSLERHSNLFTNGINIGLTLGF